MHDVGHVSAVWRYPAKSMQGEILPGTDVTADGFLGDRGWAVRDERRGGIRGAKKIGGLMDLSAHYLDEPAADDPTPTIEIALPDGSSVRSDDPSVHDRISAALDHPVTLWPLQPRTDLDHYRRGAPDRDDLEEELRDIFGREPTEPLPDLSVFPPEIIEFESPPGTYVDAFPLHIVTEQSLGSLRKLLPASQIDVRRFRPNLVIDLAEVGGDPWPEQAWVGQSLQIGVLELDVVASCPRCVMPTLSFADLPEDRRVLRTIVRETDQVLGVYATVRQPGRLQSGDAVGLGA